VFGADLHARTHGAGVVGYTLSPHAPTLATWLGEAGYRCGLFGKSHLEPELSGFVERLPPDAPYYGFHQTALSEDNLVGPYMDWIRRDHPEHEKDAWSQACEQVRVKYGWKNFSPQSCTCLEEVHPTPLPYELSQSRWITAQAERFIREQHARGEPFFAVCSYVPPHHPLTPPEPFASMYNPADMPVPKRLPADYPLPWPLSLYNYCPNLPASEIQRYIAAYYALCTMVDDCIGRLLNSLRECGADRDTIVIFTSDHGDYNGDFGLIRKCGPMWDAVLRVPMLIHIPGHAATGSRRDALSQHEDIAPTLLDLLGLPRPAQLQGVSLKPAINDPGARPRSHAFFDCEMTRETQVQGVSDGRWKLVNYVSIGDVLVDTRDDPEEMHNRAGHPEAAGVQAELEEALYRWLLRTPLARWPMPFGW
jgi:arylsulfatase